VASKVAGYNKRCIIGAAATDFEGWKCSLPYGKDFWRRSWQILKAVTQLRQYLSSVTREANGHKARSYIS
jgi:hypothetical protein